MSFPFAISILNRNRNITSRNRERQDVPFRKSLRAPSDERGDLVLGERDDLWADLRSGGARREENDTNSILSSSANRPVRSKTHTRICNRAGEAAAS